jgi:hypothetical protein
MLIISILQSEHKYLSLYLGSIEEIALEVLKTDLENSPHE